MKDSSSSSPIATQEQAIYLLDSDYQPLIAKLLNEPSTPGQLTEKLGWTMNRLYYRLKRLEAVGLVQVINSTTRWGRPSSTYAMSSASYFIPFVNTPMETINSLLRSQLEPPHEEFVEQASKRLLTLLDETEVGFQIKADNSKLIVQLSHPPLDPRGREAIVASWKTIRIKPENSEVLIKAIQEVLDEYEDENGDPFILGLHFVRK